MSQNQPDNQLVAERLLIIRRRSDLSQSEFASKIGISPRAYRNYELALRDVPLAVAATVHRVFSVSLNWLVLGEGPEMPSEGDDSDARILRAFDQQEIESGRKLPAEKRAKLLRFLSKQLSSGKHFTDSELLEYLNNAT